jgi:hypothetical protein
MPGSDSGSVTSEDERGKQHKAAASVLNTDDRMAKNLIAATEAGRRYMKAVTKAAAKVDNEKQESGPSTRPADSGSRPAGQSNNAPKGPTR